MSNLNKLIKPKINSENETSPKQNLLQQNLSAKKKYSQDEFTFKLADTSKRNDYRLRRNTISSKIEEWKIREKDEVDGIEEFKSREEEKSTEKTKTKGLKLEKIDMAEKFMDNQKQNQSRDELGSFTFLNIFNGTRNLYNDYESSTLSGLNEMSEIQSFNLTERSRKKSYQEDLSVVTTRREHFNISNNRSKYSCSPFDSDENLDTQDLIQEDNFGNFSVHHVKNYYEYTFECMKKVKKIQQMPDENQINIHHVNESFEKEVLSQSKINILFSFKIDKRLAIFDLDETLVHCVTNPDKFKENFDEVFECSLNGKLTKVGMNIRPYLKESLLEISKSYTLVVFSNNKKAYSDIILNRLDPSGKFFALRLYRNDCVCRKIDNESVYIKDLLIFKLIPQTKIVIIDKSVLSFAFQMDNGIPILPFTNSKSDNELKILVSYLNHLSQYEDLVKENKKVFGLENLFMNLSNYDSVNNVIDSNKFDSNFKTVKKSDNVDNIIIEDQLESSVLLYSEDSAQIEKNYDSDNRPTIISKVNRIEKIEPSKNKFNNLNFILNNFNSNSSYESNSLLSCVILLNKGNFNSNSVCNNNTNTFISSDYSKSDSEHEKKLF